VGGPVPSISLSNTTNQKVAKFGTFFDVTDKESRNEDVLLGVSRITSKKTGNPWLAGVRFRLLYVHVVVLNSN
jgi:hypothetical protein